MADGKQHYVSKQPGRRQYAAAELERRPGQPAAGAEFAKQPPLDLGPLIRLWWPLDCCVPWLATGVSIAAGCFSTTARL